MNITFHLAEPAPVGSSGSSRTTSGVRRSRAGKAAMLSAATCLLLAACGSSDGSQAAATTSTPAASTTTPSATTGAATGVVDDAARALLPERIRTAGVLTDGVNLPNPPMEFIEDGKTDYTGLDVELAAAIAARLGLKVEYSNVAFDQLLPSLTTGRVDIVLSGMSDTAERQAIADWVDYFNSGDRFYTFTANGTSYPDYASLCGQTVVVATGTSFVEDVPALSETACAGKDPMKVLAIGVQGNEGLEIQIQTGRAVAAVTGAETFAYQQITQPDKFVAVGDLFAPAPYGIAVTKDNSGLRDAVAAALKDLIADGTYGTILAKWNLTDSAVKAVTVNLKP